MHSALEGHYDVVSQNISQEQTNEKKQSTSTAEFIKLSDNDEMFKQAVGNSECSIWYMV